MEEYWYGNPEVSGSSPSTVKLSLPIFKKDFKEKNDPSGGINQAIEGDD